MLPWLLLAPRRSSRYSRSTQGCPQARLSSPPPPWEAFATQASARSPFGACFVFVFFSLNAKPVGTGRVSWKRNGEALPLKKQIQKGYGPLGDHGLRQEARFACLPRLQTQRVIVHSLKGNQCAFWKENRIPNYKKLAIVLHN